MKSLTLGGPLLMIGLLVTVPTCGRKAPATPGEPSLKPYVLDGRGTPALQPGIPASVTVYLKMDIEKRYGLLARLAKHRDSNTRKAHYDPDGKWWNNPLVVFADPQLDAPAAVTVGADAAPIAGSGESSNVAVNLRLVPRAEIAYYPQEQADAMKGTITVTISAESAFYDDVWNPMARVQDKVLVFEFNTIDPSRSVAVVASDVRAESGLTFERYTRDHEKWEPRSAWPRAPASGDWWIKVYGKDIRMDLKTFRYVEPAPVRTE